MILIGAVSVVIATIAVLSATRSDSAVVRRLRMLAPQARRAPRWRAVNDRDLHQAALARSQAELVAAKALGLVVGALAGAIAGGAIGAGAAASIGCAYAGFVVPSLAIERRARGNRARAERALGPFLERLEALAAAGRPVETALAAAARVSTSSSLLDEALGRSVAAYALGAPLFRTVAATAQQEGLRGLENLAMSLERARDLGRGSITVIREARDAARASERAASIEAAATVEGKLMLTLVLCYLPALMLLVVIPLFLTLLDGLFG